LFKRYIWKRKVKFLLANDANVCVHDFHGMPALQMAFESKCSAELVKLILDNGGYVNKFNAYTPLQYLAKKFPTDTSDLLRLQVVEIVVSDFLARSKTMSLASISKQESIAGVNIATSSNTELPTPIGDMKASLLDVIS
jgi:ankyrin repeat protein